jgi:hypothetical protein
MEDKLVFLKQYDTMVNAMYEKELLEENGIQSTLFNENIAELLPIFNDRNDGLCLMVFEKDVITALQFLADFEEATNAEL